VLLAAESALAAPCRSGWVQRAAERIRPSVVRVQTVATQGAGFLFHKDNWVATSYHLIERGRPVTVVTSQEKHLAAKVVAIDAVNDLALLKIEKRLKATPPLALDTTRGVAVGSEVMFVGHPYAAASKGRLRGLLHWSVGRGSISARSQQLLQLDAALNPGNSGGPVLGCDGRVVGMVSAKLSAEGIGFAIPARLLTLLATQVGVQPPYKGRLRWQLRGGVVAQISPGRAALGFALGTGIMFYDRVLLLARYNHLFGIASPRPKATVVEQSFLRNVAELEFHHRWFVQAGRASAYLSAVVGLAGGRLVEDSRALSASLVDGNCVAGDCALSISAKEQHSETWRAWPIVGLASSLGGVVDISYAFLPDVLQPTQSLHRLSLELSY
jgi:hypothetical protein